MPCVMICKDVDGSNIICNLLQALLVLTQKNISKLALNAIKNKRRACRMHNPNREIVTVETEKCFPLSPSGMKLKYSVLL